MWKSIKKRKMLRLTWRQNGLSVWMFIFRTTRDIRSRAKSVLELCIFIFYNCCIFVCDVINDDNDSDQRENSGPTSELKFWIAFITKYFGTRRRFMPDQGDTA
ncbi:hypothetical protein BD770DRAFT_405731 [Pilaira anomala]|nr:hypothetical protein BD770DRAFT_405731 [Pilaira anomala]